MIDKKTQLDNLCAGCCRFNDGVTCSEGWQFKTKCVRCGWNPTVEAARKRRIWASKVKP